MFTCGLLRTNFSLDISLAPPRIDLLTFEPTFEPLTRIELVTPSLPRRCSTTELQGPCAIPPRTRLQPDRSSGAGDGIRTRDIQLGRLELYQLSYTRPRST